MGGCQTCRQTVWIQRESSYMRLAGGLQRDHKGLPVGTHLTQMWYSDVHSSSQSCAKVGGAGKDIPQVLIPHKFMAVCLNQSLHLHTHTHQSNARCCVQPKPHLFESIAESGEDFLHVASFLHGDDPGVVLLIDPDQEGLEMVMPDAPSIWPVSGHPRSQQQGRHRLVKQKVILHKKRTQMGAVR